MLSESMTDSMAETRVTPPRGPTVMNVLSNDLVISAIGDKTVDADTIEEEKEEDADVMEEAVKSDVLLDDVGIGGKGLEFKADDKRDEEEMEEEEAVAKDERVDDDIKDDESGKGRHLHKFSA